MGKGYRIGQTDLCFTLSRSLCIHVLVNVNGVNASRVGEGVEGR